MALPDNGTPWTPTTPNTSELLLLAKLFAGKSVTDDEDTNLASANSGQTEASKRVKSGVAADITTLAANQIVGEGVGATIPTDGITAEQVDTTADRLGDYLNNGGWNASFLEAMVVASRYGGAYTRLVANRELRETPTFTTITPLRALPEWEDGVLRAALFWTDLGYDGETVYRWLEHRDNRTRQITNGLYRGTRDNLGERIPLDQRPETAYLKDETPYPEGVTRAVWYAPNILPNSRYPQSPEGSSDLQGSESLCVAVDTLYTTLIRDFRLGAAKIVVPHGTLDRTLSATSGVTGAQYNTNREIFTEVNMDGSDLDLSVKQGELRSTEHADAIGALVERIVLNAGLSPATFGLGDAASGATSGVALRLQMSRTIQTVTAKRRLWTPIIADMLAQALAADAAVWGTRVAVVRPQVSWPPLFDDASERATQIETLVRAKAISTETAVRLAQPSLDEDGVAEETARILAEQGLSPIADSELETENPIPGF